MQAIDRSLFLYLNGLHSPFFDEVMWQFSSLWIWIPFFVVLFYQLLRPRWRQGLLAVVAIALVITLCDQISSSLFKPLFERLRPTHDPEIGAWVHTVRGYRGGSFGFISSHAANTIGLITFLARYYKWPLFTWVLLVWAIVIIYSRIYLGVHYPGDVLAGSLVGVVVGWAIYQLYRIVCQKLQFDTTSTAYPHLPLIILGITLVYILLTAVYRVV